MKWSSSAMRSKKPPKPLAPASSPAGDRADVAPRMRDPALDTGQAKPSPAGGLRQREHNGSGARTARGWRVWGGAYANRHGVRLLGFHHQTIQRCVERAVVEGPIR
jgi:hypothetical protein